MDRSIRFIALSLWLVSLPVVSAQVEVQEARVWTAPGQTRLVVDVDGPVAHRIFPLKDPDRLMVDIPAARLPGKLPQVDVADPMLLRLRGGSPDGQNLRLVLDLKQPVRVKSFLMSPNERYGYRLIIDLLPKDPGKPILSAGKDQGSRQPAGRPDARGGPRARAAGVLIAIDAGHGGEDPGAIGPAGTEEKHVTLAIARLLATMIDRHPGMRTLMIRDGDYYIGLQERVALARARQADLFLSIHADAFHDSRISGSSVWILSVDGVTSEAAEWLAARENSADRIGGIELKEVDSDLNRVLFELAQNGSLEHSQYAAERVLTKLGGVGPVHHGTVQKARFVVLKSPDVPSMLVETAFLSNPQDEARLRDSRQQQRIAEAIFEGILDYLAKHPLPETTIAERGSGRQHVIHQGDTLSDIARRYEVSLSSLRVVNSLDGDRLRVGDVLTIPES